MAAVLSLLRLVPLWAYALAALLAWGGWQRHTATAATRAAVQASAALQAEAAARESEHRLSTAAREAADAYTQNLTRVQRDAAGARTELDRLRHALAAASAAGSGASAPSGFDDAARARVVVGQCAAALSEVAAAADAAEVRLVGLQSYVRGVCLAGVAP